MGCRVAFTVKVIPQKLKWPMNFFLTFPERSLPSTVSKNTIKMMGHQSRLRDMMGQSYPIHGCTRANHARYSSVQFIFCGSLKGRKFQPYGTISHEDLWNLSKNHPIVVVFAVITCIPEYAFLHAFTYIFFPSDKIFWFFLN